MGELKHFDLKNLRNFYNINTLIETGTGIGSGLNYAFELDIFETLYSCEIHEEVYKKIQIQHDKCKIYNLDSISFFNSIINDIQNKNCLFWLDAHFPGADFGFGKYSDSIDENIKFPLESEIKWLFCNKDMSNDILILDDWRVYERLNYQDLSVYDKNQYDFGVDLPIGGENIKQIIQNTHDIYVDLLDQGYLICTPKNKVFFNV